MGGLSGLVSGAGANWRSRVNKMRHETRALDRRTNRRRKKEARRMVIQTQRRVKDAGKLGLDGVTPSKSGWRPQSADNNALRGDSSLAPTESEHSSCDDRGSKSLELSQVVKIKTLLTRIRRKRAEELKKIPIHALHRAAKENSFSDIHRLCKKGANMEKRWYGWTPLSYAAALSSHDAMTALLNAGADANCRDADGWTPLHLCCWRGDAIGLEILLRADAAVDLRNKAKQTPLQKAAQSGISDLVTTLLEAGANPYLCAPSKKHKYSKRIETILSEWSAKHPKSEYQVRAASSRKAVSKRAGGQPGSQDWQRDPVERLREATQKLESVLHGAPGSDAAQGAPQKNDNQAEHPEVTVPTKLPDVEGSTRGSATPSDASQDEESPLPIFASRPGFEGYTRSPHAVGFVRHLRRDVAAGQKAGMGRQAQQLVTEAKTGRATPRIAAKEPQEPSERVFTTVTTNRENVKLVKVQLRALFGDSSAEAKRSSAKRRTRRAQAWKAPQRSLSECGKRLNSHLF